MKQFSSDFIYQLMSLIVAILLVHAIYVAVIRPNANSLLETQAELINADPTYVPERSAYIIVKDLEQEACFILMLWAMALMGIKARDNHRERARATAPITAHVTDRAAPLSCHGQYSGCCPHHPGHLRERK